MTAYTVYLDQVDGLLEKWRDKYDIYVPQKAYERFYEFRPWEPGTDIAWDYDMAYTPLKRFFLPPEEDLIKFDLRDYAASSVIQAPKQLLFGVHPYDIKAINQLDQLMDMSSTDVNYRKRRDNTVVIGLEPLQVAETAFWAGVNASEVDMGYDLFWTRISPGAFYVQVGSGHGEELLHANGKVVEASPAEKEAARRMHAQTLKAAASSSLSFSWKDIPKVMEAGYDSPLWRERAKKCLSCGSCNLVCPTCYCFDIQDEVDDRLQTGRRYRMWDGCMLEGFTRIAGDHNFRERPWQRYRHRYMRKGKYIFDKLGELGCVGCGRCVRACTARIANPKAVFTEFWEAYKNEI